MELTEDDWALLEASCLAHRADPDKSLRLRIVKSEEEEADDAEFYEE